MVRIFKVEKGQKCSFSCINSIANQFKSKEMVNLNRFYTYAYLREDKTPYYIGKGKGPRIYSTSRRIKPPKDKSRIIFLKQNLTEQEAFKHEIYMIAVFGRKDLGTGILHNRTDGGDGSSGYIPSYETRRKLSEASKGKIVSEETRKKLSASSKGKTVSEETKRKMSEVHKGHNVSEETKKKLSEANKGKKWWNDGCGNRKMMIECPGEDWKPGKNIRTLKTL